MGLKDHFGGKKSRSTTNDKQHVIEIIKLNIEHTLHQLRHVLQHVQDRLQP